MKVGGKVKALASASLSLVDDGDVGGVSILKKPASQLSQFEPIVLLVQPMHSPVNWSHSFANELHLQGTQANKLGPALLLAR